MALNINVDEIMRMCSRTNDIKEDFKETFRNLENTINITNETILSNQLYDSLTKYKEGMWALQRDITNTLESVSNFLSAQINLYSVANEEIKSKLEGLVYVLNNNFDTKLLDPAYKHEYVASQMVAVALSQVGTVGGSSYKLDVNGVADNGAWCTTFTRWVAKQIGILDKGIVPDEEWVPTAAKWFKDKQEWQGRDYTPNPGDYIFFDWGGDGRPDHVGLVEKVENGIIYTIEGNTGTSEGTPNTCMRRERTLGGSNICGFGTPDY